MGEKGKGIWYILRMSTDGLVLQSTQDDEENSDHQHEDDLDPSDDELMKTIQSKANDRGTTSSIKLQIIYWYSFS